MQIKPLFVTGIGTYVGKTIVSAVLCEQLNADYWKPVQSGDLDNTDSNQVRKLITNTQTVIHPEAYSLQLAASPHQSAKAQGVEIRGASITVPQTNHQLLIEGAGGLFVPLSSDFLMVDLIRQLDAEVVLVARNYLGCINHTLLSLHALASLQIPLKHVVLNGTFNPDSRDVILQHIPPETSWSELPEFETLNRWSVTQAPMQIP